MSGKKKNEENGNRDRKLRDSAEDQLARRSDGSVKLSSKNPEDLIHKLQVHQIELEMQNEELRRVQAELDAARAHYFDLYDLAPVGYFTLSEAGLILEPNLTAATLLGVARSALVKQPLTRFILKEDQDIYHRHRKQLFETHSTSSGQAGEPQACELRMVKMDGSAFWAHLAATAAQDADGAPVCRVVLSDITERKFRDDEREQTARLIVLVNTPGDFRKLMSDLTASLQGWSGCEAVGIRLRAGDDYPYYETRGFPLTFVQAENHLCAYGPDGKILCDGEGNPVIECMCGNILRGRFDPAKPFFTAHGSFWSNNTTGQLASTTEADRQARTRNRCNGDGYESVALISLRTGDQVFGLLQFNDHRPDRFTPELIAHFERMADSLAISLSRRQAEEALQESEASYRAVAQSANDAIITVNGDETIIGWNLSAERMFGYPEAEVLGQPLNRIMPRQFSERHRDGLKRVQAGGESRVIGETVELAGLRKDGSEFPLELSLAQWEIHDCHFYTAIIRDITERKQAEQKLQDTLESLRKAVGTTIQVMVSAVEIRDPYTAGHQSRSTDLARAIAADMGLSQEKIDAIRMAGSIHDIGKLSIPAEILSKPTKLSEIEVSLIKEHARKGYEILKNVESPLLLAEIVYQHHERMDGSGYPRHLKGDDIIMEARILAVADVVEAIASHRPYRPALGIDAALEEIEKNRGVLYDNTVADACLRLFREKGFRIT